MTSSSAAPAAATADAVELLGLVAQLEHLAFARLAADAALAPTLEHRLELSRYASTAVVRRDRVLARVAELGGDPVAAMGAYDHVLDDFDARTEPSTWWERLLKVYVGYGVADDFCRLAAAGLDETSRALVVEVLDDASHADLAVAELDAAGTDTAVSARLALWGRRLVGEALGVVQRLVVQRPGLVRLLDGTDGTDGTDGRGAGDAQASVVPAEVAAPANQAPTKLFGELTAEHTRRMTRLGLTA
ncbi:ferritin-like fold-containing protein [Cellulomonas soli]|nr:ferritin-like fold-containing protein [Cellulomonas soli]NYI57774.1 hypothetical protein [Cellulomonas soli]